MVRKVIIIACVCVLFFAFGITAHAAIIAPYGFVTNEDVVQLARDKVNSIPFHYDYVLVRYDEYAYTLYYGEDFEYSEDEYAIYTTNCEAFDIYIDESGKIEGTDYYMGEADVIYPLYKGDLIYSNLWQFPRLAERGSNFEILQTILIVVFLLSSVLSVFFRSR